AESTCLLVPSVGQCDVRRNSALDTQLLEHRRVVGFGESESSDSITGLGCRLEYHPGRGDVAVSHEFKPALDHQLNLGRFDLAWRENCRTQCAVLRPLEQQALAIDRAVIGETQLQNQVHDADETAR